MTVLDGPDELTAAVGRHLGHSEWLTITEDRVQRFADATGDHDRIHVEPERATDGAPGGVLAHPYLVVALSNYFLPQILEVRGFAAGVNTGTNRVRFPSPVGVGSRVRASAELIDVTELSNGSGLDTRVVITIELAGASMPACVIESRSRWLH